MCIRDRFKTFQGVTEDAKNTVYLRPETAQGIFVNFKNVQRTSRKKVPFGIGQIGKSFRNEITPGNFTFRTREFEQMELEDVYKRQVSSQGPALIQTEGKVLYRSEGCTLVDEYTVQTPEEGSSFIIFK